MATRRKETKAQNNRFRGLGVWGAWLVSDLVVSIGNALIWSRFGGLPDNLPDQTNLPRETSSSSGDLLRAESRERFRIEFARIFERNES